jgi:hypothetical protein
LETRGITAAELNPEACTTLVSMNSDAPSAVSSMIIGSRDLTAKPIAVPSVLKVTSGRARARRSSSVIRAV